MSLYSDKPSPSDKPQLTDEQLDAVVEAWRDTIASGYQEIINLKYASKPQIVTRKIEQDLPELLEKDMEFARQIIKKFDEWSSQVDVLILWDIDETMGAEYANYSNGGKYEWRFRPVFKDMVDYVKENYPQYKHGVLTTSSESGIQRKLAELYSDSFLSAEYTYSLSDPKLTAHDRKVMEAFSREQTGNDSITLSDGEAAKLLVLNKLKTDGVNVKNIDDGRSALVWKDDGLCVYEFIPTV